MKLETLSLHNFRQFEQLDISFDPQLTVIVGAKGAGKTSILEGATVAIGSLFLSLDGLPAVSIGKADVRMTSCAKDTDIDVHQQFPVEVIAAGSIGGHSLRWKRSLLTTNGRTTTRDANPIKAISSEYQKRMRSGDASLLLPILVYYGSERLWDYHSERQRDSLVVNSRTNGYIDSLNGSASISRLTNWFLKMTVRQYQRQEDGIFTLPELDVVYAAMEACFARASGCQNVKMKFNLHTREIDVNYLDETGMNTRIALRQLSDDYKDMISLVADIAYRMAVLNPQLLENITKETTGVVLIDEVDLHLHPAWQQNVMGDLMQIFPKVQFVVTTHDSAFVSPTDQHRIRSLSNGKIIIPFVETY